MTTKNTGGPAFPVRKEGPNLTSWQENGMTLRDYFAAKAMQMLRSDMICDWTAERAYEMADAMLAERDK